MNFIAVFLGGGIGCLLRFTISTLLPTPQNTFPWPTFIVNILGSLLIGIFTALAINIELRPELKNLLIPGLCGGLTTFSTFSKESLLLLTNGNLPLALTYILSSLLLGILSVALGYIIISKLL